MIQLTIIIDDIDVYIGMGYTHARVYTSVEETGTYTHLVDIALVASKTEYFYTHIDGTTDTWYKSSIYNSTNDKECCWSDPVKGVCPSLYHYATYPPECEFDESDSVIIRKIRRFVGDFEGLDHLYIDGSDEHTMSSALQLDGHTVDIGEKGWPVYVAINDVEKTSLGDPIIQGYQYLTFSGTIGDTDKIDVYFYTFKFSDREVYESYGDAMIPPGLTSTTITQDHLVLQSAIDLLENMTAEDMVENGARVVDDQTVYDPSPGLLERDKTIKRLRAMLDALIKQYIMSGLTGVLID